MSSRYFSCESGKLCKDATCCRSVETKPSLTIGDYLRLAEYTGEDVTEIWRKKGDFLSLNSRDDDKEYELFLSLLHDPCPYLSEDGCEAHDTKPITCVAFPLHEYMCGDGFSDQSTKTYPCLKGVEPHPEQIELGRQAIEIILDEKKMDAIFLWGQHPPHISISGISDYRGLVNHVMMKQDTLDPGRESTRTQRMINAARTMENLHATHEIVDTNTMGSLISPFAIALFGDVVTKKMKELMDNEQVLGFYAETTERWKQISGKID